MMSNKQVMAIFIVGIVLLLGAFGAGLYVVKQDTTTAPRASADAQPVQPGEQSVRDFVVHIAAFGTAEEANKTMLELRAKYPSAYTQSPKGAQGLYEVNIGPYDRRDADLVAEELRKSGRKGVMVKKWTQN